ncbi:hypothetical protein [Vibrio sp. R78045]|uniref:hypothetical protein n=1 Tax=Vibrio sp. R78045 TaxID=3093868 RepID=UPI0036F1C308
MQTATISEINKGMFFSHDAFINQPNIGKCKLVAIHNYDKSTAQKYEGYDDSTLVSLRPLIGESQIQIMIDNHTVFEVTPTK